MKRLCVICLVLSLSIVSVFSQMIDQPASIAYKGQTLALADVNEAALSQWFGVDAEPYPNNPGVKRFRSEAGDLAVIGEDGRLDSLYFPGEFTIIIGDIIFTTGELKADIDLRLPEPTDIGDLNRPLI